MGQDSQKSEEPKKGKDDLQTLIHSMNIAEKGYFSKYAQRHTLGEVNNYLILFNLLAEMPDYDAAAIEQKMKAHGANSNLLAVKSQLKSIIFRAMREYNSQRNNYQKLLDGIANLEFLADKKLLDLMGKELRRLKKIAVQQEEFHILMKISEYERRLHKETANKGFVEGMEQVLAETKGYLDQYQELQENAHLMDMVFVLAKKAGADQAAALQNLRLHPKLVEESRATGTFAEIYRHQTLAMLALISLKPMEALFHYAKIMEMWELHPHFILEHASTYRRVLGNYLSISAQVNDYSRFEELIAKLKESPCQQLAERVEVFSIASISELQWHMGLGNWQKMEAIIPTIQLGLQEFESSLAMAPVLAIQYNCAIFYFLSNQDKACNRILQAIINCPATEQRMDIQRLARVLELLLLWKQAEIELLEYRLRSTSRYLANHGSGKLEDIVMDLLQKLLREDSRANCRALMEGSALVLETEQWENVMGASAIQAWLSERVSGKSALDQLLSH